MSRRRPRPQTPFKQILVQLMDEKNIGVREAAKISGVSPSTISDWRSGTLPEDFTAVQKLARALGVSFSYLLTGVNETRPEGPPSVAEVFSDGGVIFDGFAKIQIQRLVPKTKKDGEGL